MFILVPPPQVTFHAGGSQGSAPPKKNTPKPQLPEVGMVKFDQTNNENVLSFHILHGCTLTKDVAKWKVF